ncbi:TetR/AcrR family transcriptional regulator [Rhizobium sp. A22-96]|jgi:AcrR family transcriptional regulator|uniref:TetR/AcrR family transcriptional regulator n=1 Tax=Rhizobium rhizogenes TaxID=359 RepID=UPI001571FA33|nr:TetR/AcrR family transcriptional regulator [Rhizobium rhizogenes]NTF44531.1 TetR/AcrR family transcriptional regulator [Rhizobium rhizogenes]
MPRPTRAEIDAEILDHAAGLFAKHGFANTSLQQIADAVNYSKAGLLHHYPSKQALYDAAMETSRDHMETLRASVEALAPGIERDRAVVEASVTFAYDWPGISAFQYRLAENGQNADPEMIELGMIMYAALGIDMQSVEQERIVRVTSAFTGLGITASVAVRADLKREWRGFIVAAAMDALGHAGSSSRKAS